MSYTPTTWATGDTVTAALLNKMEQGISAASSGGGGGSGGGVLVVTATLSSGTYTLDMTASELETALTSVPFAVCKTLNEDDGWDIWPLCGWYPYDEEFGYGFLFKDRMGQDVTFGTMNGSSYPTASA